MDIFKIKVKIRVVSKIIGLFIFISEKFFDIAVNMLVF
jgi:hypothetical protein